MGENELYKIECDCPNDIKTKEASEKPEEMWNNECGAYFGSKEISSIFLHSTSLQ